MTERPILFSGPMVRAILAGKKRQTRRVIKPQPPACDETCARTRFYDMGDGAGWACANCGAGVRPVHRNGQCVDAMGIKCPYGQPGDVLWVRETWAVASTFDDTKPSDIPHDAKVFYAADGVLFTKARPSLFMPRWASRLSLPLKSVRVERVQDISEADAKAEGLYEWSDPPRVTKKHYGVALPDVWETDPRKTFARLWDSINGKTYPWSSNPWAWVLEFERVQG